MSVIFADSRCDLDKVQLKKLNIGLVEFGTDNLSAFKSAFQPYLDEDEDIIYLSSNLKSVEGDFNSAVKYFSNLYEKRVIRAFDLNLSSVASGLVVYEAGLMYKRGCTDFEIVDFVNTFKTEVYGFLITQNKDFITKNCPNNEKYNINGTSNLIFPVIFANGGKFEVMDKAQGKKKAIGCIVNLISEYSTNVADYPFIVGYFDDEVNAEYLKSSLISKFGEDTIVLLQKFNNENTLLLDKKSIFVSFYSKKIKN